MMGRKVYQEKLFYNFSLEKKVPEDHILRKINELVDLKFIRELVAPYYSHTGQPSVDPVVLFKMMLIGYFYNITSERRLAEELSLNLAYMWFLGYDIDEATPNHSVISKARARYGKDIFEKFFEGILEQCIRAGLVKCEKVFIDSTLIEANASMKSVVPRQDALEVKLTPTEYIKEVYKENPVSEEECKQEGVEIENREEQILPEYNNKGLSQTKTYRQKHLSNLDYVSKTDSDASIIARPGKGVKLCYKGHFTVDSKARVITGVVVSEGARDDGEVLKELIERQPMEVKEICGDSKYGIADNYEYSIRKGMIPSIPRWHRPAINKREGQWDREKFRYDKEKDIYICPGGKELKKVAYWKGSKQWAYRSKPSQCKGCKFKGECLGAKTNCKSISRHIHQEILDKVEEYLKTEKAKESIRERKIYSELIFAEAKTLHGLNRARYRGKWKVNIQALLTAAVQNIKRLIKHYETGMRSIKEKIRSLNGGDCFSLMNIFNKLAFSLS